MNGPNKLEFYIALGWKDLPGQNPLGYWVFLNYYKNEGLGWSTRNGFTLESSTMHSQILS
jgi:hypothetical protein